MVSDDLVNKVMKNIDRRNATDVRLYPSILIIVLVMFAAVAVYTLFFKESAFTDYEKQLQTLGVFVVGMGILLALMNVLASRSYKHNKKDAQLMESLIELSTALFKEKGVDGGQYITKMRKYCIDNTNQTFLYAVFLLALIPAVAGTVLMVFDITNHFTVIASYMMFGMSVLICAFILFLNIRYPKKHEKAFVGFSDAFCEGMSKCGITVKGYEPVIGIRPTPVMLFLSVVTFGVFYFIWVYFSMRDMNRHLDQQWDFENSIVDVLAVM